MPLTLLSRIKENRYCSAVILAAGLSTRMGKDKMFSDLCGIPVLARTISAFENSPEINEIIVVTRPDSLEAVAELKNSFAFSKIKKLVVGGKTRTHSALAGVSETYKRADIICIHDGARPFVTQEIIHDAIQVAAKYKAAVPCIPVKDTLKCLENGFFSHSVDRNIVFAVQTPQAFQPDIIKAALSKAVASGFEYTDDSAALEAIGIKSHSCLGSELNIKITTPFDLAVGNAIIHSFEE